MLTVQTVSGSIEGERRNGSSQSKYHGYTTGAQTSEAVMGQENASNGVSADLLLSQMATRKPTKIASAATSRGAAIFSSIANTGSLKRKRST